MNLVFASANTNKVSEIRAMLPDGYSLLGLADIGCHDDIPETADTFDGNAKLKADYVTDKFGYDCFADDSGLEVEALGGAPGVYSARYAGIPKDDAKNILKLLEALEGETNRRAQFRTVIALNHLGETHFFDGIVTGVITKKPSGNNGFGYDPVFIPDGHERTFAQMSQAEKATISHRGRALQKLLTFLKKNP